MYYSLINSMSKGGVAFDADATAFITAASITDATQKSAINTLVKDLKTSSIWTKMKAMYPMVGGTASRHKFNLKDPRDLDAAYRLQFVNGWTHSTTGAMPNGVDGYADTKFIPSTNSTLTSNGLGMYLGTLNTSASSDPIHMGAYNSALQATLLFVNKANTNISTRMHSAAITSSSITATGLISSQRNSALVNIYKNSTQVANVSSSGSLPNIQICLGNMSFVTSGPMYSSGWVNSEFRFAYISDGLNSTDISNLYTAVQAFNTTLSRNV